MTGAYAYVVGWIYTCSSTVPLHNMAWSRCSAVPDVFVGISQEVPWLLWQSVWPDSHTLQCRSRSYGNFHRSGLSARPGEGRTQGRRVWMCLSDEEQPRQHGADGGYHCQCLVPSYRSLVTLSCIARLPTLTLMNLLVSQLAKLLSTIYQKMSTYMMNYYLVMVV